MVAMVACGAHARMDFIGDFLQELFFRKKLCMMLKFAECGEVFDKARREGDIICRRRAHDTRPQCRKKGPSRSSSRHCSSRA